MKIQVIQHSNNSETEREGIQFSPMRSPRALDDYDINIIDLSAASLWKYHFNINKGQVDSLADLKTLQQMVDNKKAATVVYVMPQNIRYTYDLQYSTSQSSIPIKDVLNGVLRYSIAFVIPNGSTPVELAYEKTNTDIGDKTYSADFYLPNSSCVITKSRRSEKPTTVQINKAVFVTTLAITQSSADLKYYVSALFDEHKREEIPAWMNTVVFGDDALQNAQIEKSKVEIETAMEKIKAAETKLGENAKYKSILYTNGEELVEVVFDILEKILACNLSNFEDVKKEDFLIKLPLCTFIGEIKGVTSNIKSEHISQLDVHYYGYTDRLTENGISENVKQILIMNPFRNKALEERAPVHTSQIELAVRNQCLIIETYTLLRLYEKFCNGEVTTQKCVDVFLKKSGLLSLEDFEEYEEDNEPYKI